MDGAGRLTLEGAELSPNEAAIDAAWANAEVFESPIAREFMIAILKSPAPRWVQSGGAGFDHPIFRQLVTKGVRLTTSHGQAIGMADYVLAQVLDRFQRGPERRAAQAGGVWRRLPFREIMGSSWLIVGFGAIGQAVAARARAFGAAIAGVRRNLAPHPLADRIVALDGIGKALAQSDVVVLCAPLNGVTRHLANEGFFAAMKPGSVLVNVGRGGLVDEAALLTALDRGSPAHAILDVFETEPLAPRSPFWRHPAVTLSAHCSGATEGQGRRNQALFLDNLGRFLAGEPLLGEVDPRDVLAA